VPKAESISEIHSSLIEKTMKELTHVVIILYLKERTDMALYFLKSTGEFDAVVQEWEAKPAATITWQNINSLICRRKQVK
jgi:hypothetical protein